MGCKKKTLNKIKITSAGFLVLIIAFLIFRKHKKNKLGGEFDADDFFSSKSNNNINSFGQNHDQNQNSSSRSLQQNIDANPPPISSNLDINADEGNLDDDYLEKKFSTLKRGSDSDDDDDGKVNLPDTDNYLVPKKDAKKKKIDKKAVKNPFIIRVKNIEMVRKIILNLNTDSISYDIIKFGADPNDSGNGYGSSIGLSNEKKEGVLILDDELDEGEREVEIKKFEKEIKTVFNEEIKIVPDEDYV